MRSPDYERLLAHLYERQLALRGDEYLHLHSHNRAVIRRHVDVVERYLPFVLPGRVLDWGCRHGVDSSLLREALGDAVELHGCDLLERPYEVFAAHSRLAFTGLGDPVALPYESDFFDTVVGSGVLEHVDRPDESLGELRRVLRPGGRLIITFLPNLFSYTEVGRTVLRQEHHIRRYTRRGIERALRGHGLEPLHSGYHQVLPTLSGPTRGRLAAIGALRRPVERLYVANARLERTWPFDRVATNILVVAEKR